MFGLRRKARNAVDPEIDGADIPEPNSGSGLGHEAAIAMASDLDAIMESRFQQVFDGYLRVLRDCIHKSFNSTEGPPLTLVRIHFASFLENIGTLKGSMTAEIHQRMVEWARAADAMQVREPFDAFIANRVDQFCHDLTTRGLGLLNDYGSGLREADGAWRAANPREAAKFPLSN
jgi:hypothetical protein